jgi:predicted Zn-dependent peptidase
LENEEVYEQYCEILASCPIDIFVVGPNLSPLPALINSWKWKRKSLKSLAQITDKQVNKPQEIRENRDVQQAILVMGYRTKQKYLSAGYYALLVANGILGVFPHSKLFINVRERASLAYYVGSTLEGTKGLMIITAGIAQESYDQAVEIINQQLIAVQNGDISDDELNRTKIGLISGIRSMVDDPASIIDQNVLGIVHNHLRSAKEVMQRIAAVTKEQAQKAAQEIQLDTIYFLAGRKGEQ